jgi:glycosyltransferase involved in cell wall biosynthesis
VFEVSARSSRSRASRRHASRHQGSKSGTHVTNILIVANTAWNIYNFRSSLITSLIKDGARVAVAAPPDEYVDRIEALGCTFHPLPMQNAGTNPAQELMLLYRLRRLMRALNTDLALTFTVKPNVYGAIAAWNLGVPVICNVTGLGTAFLRQNWMSKTVCVLYRFALHRAAHSFFQNDDHHSEFVGSGLAPAGRCSLLPGSGIDIDEFRPREASKSNPIRFRFLLFGRMLWDKGVGEYVAAARKVRLRHPNADFQLMGFVEVANRSAIPKVDIERWTREGVISYMPACDDVRDAIAESDCVVLPSYTEGMPRSLLEAASMGKPLIATDVPGCRHIVEDGVNGFLARPRDASSLAEQMSKMLALSPGERDCMGQRGREKAVREFDERIVVEGYREQIKRCVTWNQDLASRHDAIVPRLPEESLSSEWTSERT